MHKYFTTFAKLIGFTEFNNNYFAKFSGFCKVKSVVNFLLHILCITFEKFSSILNSMFFMCKCIARINKNGVIFLQRYN